MCWTFLVNSLTCSNETLGIVCYHYLEGLHTKLDNNTNGTPTRFGYELLRDHVLPSVLGSHEGEILYWSGKEIARKFPIFSIDELPSFFIEAGWGTLSLKKSSKKEVFYTLTNNTYSMKVTERTYQLEAGFIAEQYQKINGFLTECYAEPKVKSEQVQFQVKWDTKTII